MAHLEGQVAVITGGATGIGWAVAQAFLKEGARIALVGRSKDSLEEAATKIPHDRVLCCRCDVSDREAVNTTFARIVKEIGMVSILINNAGINTGIRSVAEVDPRDWDQTIEINLTGAFNCIRAVLPGMRDRRFGLVINIASIAAKRALKLAGAAYSASKHGMLALTHNINEEEFEYGIRATAICPGEVDTPILDQRPQPVNKTHREQILKPEDIGAAALFVASLPHRACVPELIIKPLTQVYN